MKTITLIKAGSTIHIEATAHEIRKNGRLLLSTSRDNVEEFLQGFVTDAMLRGARLQIDTAPLAQATLKLAVRPTKIKQVTLCRSGYKLGGREEILLDGTISYADPEEAIAAYESRLSQLQTNGYVLTAETTKPAL